MKMTRIVTSVIVLSVLAAANKSKAQDAQTWNGTCQIKFSGKSTLHPFAGTVSAEPFSIAVTNPTDPAKAVAKGRVVAKASKLNTSNTKRDKKMYKVLGATSFSDIVVDIGALTVAATKAKSGGQVPQPTIVPFTLTIKEKTKKIIGQISNWSYSEKKISFQVAFPVSLSAFEIKPPTVAGIVKVDDTILVHANLVLQRN